MSRGDTNERLDADLARLRGLSGIKWTRYPADVLPLWVADMDLPPAPPIVEALRELTDRGDFGYSFAAHAALPEVFAGWYGERHGWRPDPSRVRVFTDVLQGTDTIPLAASLKNTDEVVAARQLGIYALRMMIPVAPGAPLCRASSEQPRFDGLQIVLKGGQNGAADYLERVQYGLQAHQAAPHA